MRVYLGGNGRGRYFSSSVVENWKWNFITSTDDTIHYSQEFINSLPPLGFPPHNLKLKIGAQITLLRNLQPPNLCNGTRLQIKSLQNNVIEALQFPVKVSFVITINKGQGQTFEYVSVDIRTECFSHGQLSVGLSLTGDPNHLMILISTGDKTKNVIYSEVL
ncbi:ATP-dependent DNA helicase [Aphis craccivora]|uniref:ATP-dependent DNA helicase n=1 Tax=Aphis craccivora TaxID=307492 RepID=A0A6G0YSB1_APHCR|nr:ATP-dependent DNA helicase [Aphis craccivora]